MKKAEQTKKFKFNKKHYILCMIAAVALVLTGIYYYVFRSPPYKLEYAIKTLSDNDNILNVNLKISNLRNRDTFELYKGKVEGFEYTLRNLKDNSKTTLSEDGQYIQISNIYDDFVILGYKVKIGDLNKHGHRGEVCSDLLTFGGEQVLILPLDSFELSENGISQVTVNVKYEEGWTSVVPFEGEGLHEENTSTSIILRPKWHDLYNLSKSCFAFGKFNKLQLKSQKSIINLYTDTAMGGKLSQDTKEGIISLFDYYNGFFEKDLPQFSVVMMGNSSDGGIGIMGGSGTSTLGSSFDENKKRDWELMAHRLYHAYFDMNVRTPQIHNAPYEWFYEGLATYYENVAIGFLPEKLKTALKIDTEKNFDSLFKKYVYMYHKDPKIKEIIPMNEEQYGNSNGKIEFLHYTIAPLVIKAIENKSFEKHNQWDRTLNYILKKYNNRPFDIKDILNNSIGDEGDGFYNSYVLSNNTLPLWKKSDKNEDTTAVINDLNETEYTLYTWFEKEFEGYPLDILTVEKLSSSLNKAIEQNIHFTDSKTETMIMDLSPTVYSVLMQNALKDKLDYIVD